jgi:putative transposase
MSKLRRYPLHGHPCFITCVAYERSPIIVRNVDLMYTALESARIRAPHELIAFVFLPEHFHAVIDPLNGDISGLMQRLKMSFGALLRKRTGRRAGRVWQHRFYDHVIRDQEDLNRHIDYVHYNPVKHGIAVAPLAWKHSTYDRFYRDGLYSEDWGVKEAIEFEGDFGE